MISDKDRAVVASMARMGMNLDTLKKSFPKFDANDIKKIYNDEVASLSNETFEEINISCNCS